MKSEELPPKTEEVGSITAGDARASPRTGKTDGMRLQVAIKNGYQASIRICEQQHDHLLPFC